MKQVEAFWLAVQFWIAAFGQGSSSVKEMEMTTLLGVGPVFRG